MTRTPEPTVLLLGATGRTGRHVLEQLLDRGVAVRVVVRSAARLPPGVADDPRLTVGEADLLSLSDGELLEQVRGCDAVISCLGHTVSLKGIFGAPRDLVTRAATRVCRAIGSLEPVRPVRFILMSSVSVNDPAGLGSRRGRLEKMVLWALRVVTPPARDNQRAADLLHRGVGSSDPFVQWVAVRPDTLREGGVSEYGLHEDLVDGLFSPGRTARANVAHFMCDLATDAALWDRWKGRLPVIVDVVAAGKGADVDRAPRGPDAGRTGAS